MLTYIDGDPSDVFRWIGEPLEDLVDVSLAYGARQRSDSRPEAVYSVEHDSAVTHGYTGRRLNRGDCVAGRSRELAARGCSHPQSLDGRSDDVPQHGAGLDRSQLSGI